MTLPDDAFEAQLNALRVCVQRVRSAQSREEQVTAWMDHGRAWVALQRAHRAQMEAESKLNYWLRAGMMRVGIRSVQATDQLMETAPVDTWRCVFAGVVSWCDPSWLDRCVAWLDAHYDSSVGHWAFGMNASVWHWTSREGIFELRLVRRLVALGRGEEALRLCARIPWADACVQALLAVRATVNEHDWQQAREAFLKQVRATESAIKRYMGLLEAALLFEPDAARALLDEAVACLPMRGKQRHQWEHFPGGLMLVPLGDRLVEVMLTLGLIDELIALVRREGRGLITTPLPDAVEDQLSKDVRVRLGRLRRHIAPRQRREHIIERVRNGEWRAEWQAWITWDERMDSYHAQREQICNGATEAHAWCVLLKMADVLNDAGVRDEVTALCRERAHVAMFECAQWVEHVAWELPAFSRVLSADVQRAVVQGVVDRCVRAVLPDNTVASERVIARFKESLASAKSEAGSRTIRASDWRTWQTVMSATGSGDLAAEIVERMIGASHAHALLQTL